AQHSEIARCEMRPGSSSAFFHAARSARLRLFVLALLIAGMSTITRAQDKVELFGGYSYFRASIREGQNNPCLDNCPIQTFPTSCLVSQGNPRMRLASAQPLHKPPASLASDRIPPGPALWAAASTGTWLLLSPFASFKSIASAPTCTAPRKISRASPPASSST